MGAGGVAAGTREPDVDQVGGRGDRPGAEPDGADRRARVAVQGEDRRGPVDHTRPRPATRRRRAPTPRPAGRSAAPARGAGPRQLAARASAGAERGRGVDVVAAGVADARHRRTGRARPWRRAAAARRCRPGGHHRPGRRRCRRPGRCRWGRPRLEQPGRRQPLARARRWCGAPPSDGSGWAWRSRRNGDEPVGSSRPSIVGQPSRRSAATRSPGHLVRGAAPRTSRSTTARRSPGCSAVGRRGALAAVARRRRRGCRRRGPARRSQPSRGATGASSSTQVLDRCPQRAGRDRPGRRR